MPNRPVLAATDFGARADRAIDRALMLGEQFGRPVKLIYALDHKTAETVDRAELDRQMEASLPAGAGEVEFLYPEGLPPVAIAAAADEQDAYMLVIGVARYNSIRDFLLGTSVDYVLRNTQRPVLVVKQRPSAPYGDIVAPTDFSKASRYAIERAAEMFPEAKFHIVHAYQIPFEAWQKAEYVHAEVREGEQEKLDEFVATLDLSDSIRATLTSSLLRGSTHQAVAKEISEYGCRLAVVGSHGESGFKHATIGSTTSALLESVTVDMMVVNTAGAES